MLATDMKLMSLQMRDEEAIRDYSFIERRMDKAVLAAISSGRSVDEARAVAVELYGEDKAFALHRLQRTGEELYEHRRLKSQPDSKRWWWPW